MSAVGAYLAKKNWNPGNKKNVEDVWKKEQAKKNEEKKLQELRKEYEEERNREQLEELQVRAGVKKSSTRLEWMYEGPPVDSKKLEMEEKEREAFLLGEKSIDKMVAGADNGLKAHSRKAPISMLAAAAAAAPPQQQLSNNEVFLRRHEDPLAYIQEQTQLKREREEVKEKHRHKRSKRDREEEEEKEKKSKKSKKKSSKD